MVPAFAGEHYFANRPKGISLQMLLFGTCSTTFATTKNNPWPSKSRGKTSRFSTFSLFGPSCFEYASKLLIYLNVLPARAGSTFLQIGAQSCSIKIQFFGLDVPPNALLPHLGCKADKPIYFANLCIICTWARLEAPLSFLLLQISWFLLFFSFRPFISLEFSTQSKFKSFAFLEIWSPPR